MTAADWPDDGWPPEQEQERPAWSGRPVGARAKAAGLLLAVLAAAGAGYATAKATVEPQPVTVAACATVLRTALADRLAAVLR